MTKKIMFVNVIALFYYTFGQIIEFYPSQSWYEQSNKKELYINTGSVAKSQKCEKILPWYDNKLMKRSNFMREFSKEIEVKIVTKKRAVDPIFHGYPKTREELWHQYFLNETVVFDQTSSLIELINNITLTYLDVCIPVILYDEHGLSKEGYLLQNLLKDFPVSYILGCIDENNQVKEPKLLDSTLDCLNFILLLEDVKVSAVVLGKQSENKVVVIPRSSQWAVQEFLTSSLSRKFVNLLVIGQSFKDENESTEAPFILYTHKLYADGLGASNSRILTSWSRGKFSRKVDLFPTKMTEGYSGHRFLVAAANQPPFVFKRFETDLDGGNQKVVWDGIEIRLLHLLAERHNFSVEFTEPRNLYLGPGDAVAQEILLGKVDMGVAGMYLTKERNIDMDMSVAHSQDCAVFITLMSTALPRYRAILGPFHWHVWVALTLTYLFGIFPLAFSDKHTLRHLLDNTSEVENMFWYVFGTFTNCFTFVGKNSWSKTTKITTRLLIGWYWLFTIIITSCYTGSIIAFVTLPVYPETVDSIQQLLQGFYRVGTLDHGGWERWFNNSFDPDTNKLLKRMEYVSNVESGIRNITKAFFWPFAFLGSKAELEYIVQSNFSISKSKRSLLHISNECFVPFGVAIAFPNNSLYTAKLSGDILRMTQYGILSKVVHEVRWEMQRSSTRNLLSVAKESLKKSSIAEKGLTLEDTQGMFLLLGAGFLIAATALLSEWMGGFTRQCRKIKTRFSTGSNSRGLLSASKTGTYNMRTLSKNTDTSIRTSSTSGSEKSFHRNRINVTDYDIVVHNNSHTVENNTRRSSSVDFEREITEIFELDEKRINVYNEVDAIKFIKDDREETASVAFGERVFT